MADETVPAALFNNMEQTAFKAVSAANGGAIIALLTFLGNLMGKADRVPVSISLRVAMLCFAFGVFCAVAGTVAGYIAALNATNPDYEKGLKLALPMHVATLFSLLLGALAFIVGAVFAAFGLT
jgi:hypothetical protein